MRHLLALPLLLALSTYSNSQSADDVEDWVQLVEQRSSNYFEIKKRRSTVRKLAEQGSEEAWDAVVFALGDQSPMVADEAQIQLAKLTDPELKDDLFGKRGLKSREDHVAERVAEALGRMEPPIDAKAMTKALGSKDPVVRRLLLWSVERLAQRELVAGNAEKQLEPALAKLHARDKDRGVRAAALMALAALHPEAAAELLPKASLDKAPEVRCAAAMLLGSGIGGAPEAALRPLLQDPDVGVRTAVVLALAELGTSEAAVLLAEHLGAESSLRLRHRLVTRLQELSGLKYKLDPRPWRDWAAALGDDFRPSFAAGTRSRGVRESTAQLASLPLRTQRMALLIDFSGSIWDPNNAIEGRIRKEWLGDQLEAMSRAFSVETHFNLIPYTYDPIPWQEEAQSAKPKTVRKALVWYNKRNERGKGNYYDAAALALEDRSVDSLIAFTDGAPSGGYHWNMELIVDLLLERNRFRLATFDALLIDTPGNLLREWRRLAEETDGQVVLLGEGAQK